MVMIGEVLQNDKEENKTIIQTRVSVLIPGFWTVPLDPRAA